MSPKCEPESLAQEIENSARTIINLRNFYLVWFLGLSDGNGLEMEKGLNVRKNEVWEN
jgi:hypothetical protein